MELLTEEWLEKTRQVWRRVYTCRCVAGYQEDSGEPQILVPAQWFIDHHKGTIDHGCSQCVGEDLASDFVCVYHRAVAAIRALIPTVAAGEKDDQG
jgi:hypothetical protein